MLFGWFSWMNSFALVEPLCSSFNGRKENIFSLYFPGIWPFGMSNRDLLLNSKRIILDGLSSRCLSPRTLKSMG